MTTSDNRHDPTSEPPLEQRARKLWHEAARHIDPATAGRLRAARRQALATARTPAWPGVRWLIPTGAFAVIALAAMMVWQPPPRHGAAPAIPSAAAVGGAGELDNELPPDADQTDPNLYQNLDFYGWLASNDSRPANR